MSVKKTNKVILLGEDSVQGSILESIAAQVSEKLFEYLDAPIKILGAQNTPVPYAPSLEEAYLLSSEKILENIEKILKY